MMKQTARFSSPDGGQTLTIVAGEGKKGFNVKASVKNGKGKGQPKAITGARSQHATEKAAVDTFVKLVEDANREGWQPRAISSKNAFTGIPKPGALTPKLVQKPNGNGAAAKK